MNRNFEIREYRPFLVMMPFLIQDSIKNYDRFNECPESFGTWYLLLTVFISLFMYLLRMLKDHNLFEELQLAAGAFFLFYLLWSLVGTVIYVTILIKGPNQCMMPGELFGFGVMFLFFIVALSLVLYKFGTLLREHLEEERRRHQARREYTSVFERIQNDPDFDYRSFLEEYREPLAGFEVLEEDVRVLKEHCLVPFSLRQSRSDSTECTICQGEYEEGDQLFEHPICRHRYHWECIEVWLKTKRICPMCRRGTRVSLVEMLGKRLEEGVELENLEN